MDFTADLPAGLKELHLRILPARMAILRIVLIGSTTQLLNKYLFHLPWIRAILLVKYSKIFGCVFMQLLINTLQKEISDPFLMDLKVGMKIIFLCLPRDL